MRFLIILRVLLSCFSSSCENSYIVCFLAGRKSEKEMPVDLFRAADGRGVLGVKKNLKIHFYSFGYTRLLHNAAKSTNKKSSLLAIKDLSNTDL